MDITPDWQATRISHLDVLIAWDVCTIASRNSGAITKVAADYHLPPATVQKALDRVETAMGGKAFFIMGRKRTSRLSPTGERFIRVADTLLGAWGAALSPGTTPEPQPDRSEVRALIKAWNAVLSMASAG